MAKNKTSQTSNNVENLINSVKDEAKRKDCLDLIKLLKKLTGFEPKMWGTSIVGFGSYHYKYESGREGDSALVAFSPRVSALTLYLSGHFEKREELLKELGKYKTDKGCVYIKALADIHIETLKKMVINHIKHIRELYPDN